MKAKFACDLCGGGAALRCDPDAAFLCWICDARVHGANFLVARHARRLLCVECGGHAEDDEHPVSGPGFRPTRFVCRSCSGDHGADLSLDSDSSSCCSSTRRDSASSCVSSAESGGPTGGARVISGKLALSLRRGGPRHLGARIEAALQTWCRRLGLDDSLAAVRALRDGVQRMRSAPLRAIAAASAWLAAGKAGRGGAEQLRQLEACSGVPARLILVTKARLSRAMRRCHVGDGAEGSAECS